MGYTEFLLLFSLHHTKRRALYIFALWFRVVLTGSLVLSSSWGHAQSKAPIKKSSEMEFDARVIQGQRAEGTIYLFQRASRPLPPLLNFKRNYIGAIVSPVFGRDTALGKAVYAQSQQQLTTTN